MRPLAAMAAIAGDRRGIALVTVLWSLVLLSILATGFSSTTRTDVRIARNVVEAARAEALADGGVHRAIFALLARNTEELGWAHDGTPRHLRTGDGELTVAIEDEGGKIDLNMAGEPLLRGLLVSAGVTPTKVDGIVDAILDWRDDNHLTRSHGAEDNAYAAAGLDHDAKDAPFDTVEELHQVLGMTPELFDRIAPALTVYSARPGIDPTVAAHPALRALPELDTEAIEEIEQDRRESWRLAMASPDVSGDSRSYLSRSRQTSFTIRAIARTRSGAVFVREAVVYIPRSGRRTFAFMDWRQGRLPAASD